MFDSEFFPTPPRIISKMIAFMNQDKDFYVLEPSAGKGNILDALKSNWKVRKLYAIEKNPELAMILQEKGYTVLDNDFLEYQKDTDFNAIIMNPPFSNGDEHFLKAWEIMENGTIVCLLNAETIRNPFSEKRKLVAKIIEDNGGVVEYLGSCFSESERPTNVEVAMVTIHKVTNNPHFDFGEYDSERVEMNETMLNNELATLDIVQNIIDDYARAKKLFAEGLEAINKANQITKSICSYEVHAFEIAKENGPLQGRLTEFCDRMRHGVWTRLTEKLSIEKYMTTKLRDNFRDFMKKQGGFAISKNNVKKFVDFIMMNRGNIMENAISEAFDMFTKYYHENREHIEGWKTNDSWKVNRKIVMPNWVETDYSGGLRVSSARYKMDDVDKALCYISGQRFENIVGIEHAITASINFGHGSICSSHFFDIKFYKKGTVHLTFKDESLWQEFNMRACDQKNWLPPEEKDEWKKKKNTFSL